MLTDEQIIERSSQGGGLNAEEAINLTLERDICKSAINNVISKLKELK